MIFRTKFFGLALMVFLVFGFFGGVLAVEYASSQTPSFIVYPISVTEKIVFPKIIEPGEKGVVITVGIRHNDFKDTVRNLKGIMHFSNPLVAVGSNVVEVGEIKPYVVNTLGFSADVLSNAKRGTYNFTFELIYDYLENTGISQKFPITVVITGSPILDITDIVISPKTANPGNQVTIEAIVRNVGTYTSKNTFVSIEPLEIALGMGSAVSNPSLSSQVSIIPRSELKVFVENLDVGESKKVSFVFDIDPSANPSVYPLALKVESEGISEIELIAIDIQGQPELTLANAETDVDKVVAGGDFSLSIQLDNIGSDSALSTEVAIVDAVGLLGKTTNYVGTIDVGDSGSAIFDFTVPKNMGEGKKVVELKVTYLDENRDIHFFKKEVELFVFKAPKAFDLTPILVGVVVIVIGFFGYRFIQRKRKLKQIGI